MTAAAFSGHFELLKWMRREGCPWNNWVCAHAAQMGHLKILKWLRREGCPWNEMVAVYAAGAGRLDVGSFAPIRSFSLSHYY